MSDKIEFIYAEIEIIYAELVDVRHVYQKQIELRTCSWTRNSKLEIGNWSSLEHPIPDDVRIALALLVAPGLVCPVGEKKGEA